GVRRSTHVYVKVLVARGAASGEPRVRRQANSARTERRRASSVSRSTCGTGRPAPCAEPATSRGVTFCAPSRPWTRPRTPPGAGAGCAGTAASDPARIRRNRSSAGEEPSRTARSEEHTSELQSRFDLVCRLLLEKKKNNQTQLTHE